MQSAQYVAWEPKIKFATYMQFQPSFQHGKRKREWSLPQGQWISQLEDRWQADYSKRSREWRSKDIQLSLCRKSAPTISTHSHIHTRLDNVYSRKFQQIQGPTEELGVGDLLKGVDPLDPWVAGYAVDIPPAMALWQCISCENIPHDQQQNRISTPTSFPHSVLSS